MSPAWRPVRIGVAALAVAQIVGLNLWAFHQKNEVQARRNAIQALVESELSAGTPMPTSSAIGVRMLHRAQARLPRAGSKQTAASSRCCPARRRARQNEQPLPGRDLRFEQGKLTIAATGWTDAQIDQFRSVLQPAGFQVNASEGRIVVTRTRPAA